MNDIFMNHLELIDIVAEGTYSESSREKGKFLFIFRQFYSLPILRTNLNFIAQKIKNGEVGFNIKLSDEWDFIGYHNVLEDPKNLIITSLDADKIMSEIAFIVARYNSDLLIDLKDIVLADIMKPTTEGLSIMDIVRSGIKNPKNGNWRLIRMIARSMIERIENKCVNHSLEELYTGFFMVLSLCSEIIKWNKKKNRKDIDTNYEKVEDIYSDPPYDFKECKDFFRNTVRWIEEYFNPIVNKKIDNYILNSENEIVLAIENYEKRWLDGYDYGRPKLSNDDFRKISRADSWFNSWKEYQNLELEKEKIKTIEVDEKDDNN